VGGHGTVELKIVVHKYGTAYRSNGDGLLPDFEFVNHSSVIIRSGGVALIADPWLERGEYDPEGRSKPCDEGFCYSSDSNPDFLDERAIRNLLTEAALLPGDSAAA